MRRHFFMGLLLLLPALAFAAPPPAPQASPQNTCMRLSANLLQDLQKGDFTAATDHFDSEMKAGLSPQKIKQTWQQAIPQMFGEFKRVAAPKEAHEGNHSIVITPLQFANAWGKMVVTCNANGQIAGWRILPGTAPSSGKALTPASSTAWIAQAAVGAKTLPITVQRKGFVLKGVLDLPAGKGPFGVVDIIPGSGPVDINGNAGPVQYGMYKKLAAALVKSGWAVARVAKRYVPPSTGNAKHYVFSDQVSDNLAIVEALRNNPHVNPKRIVVVGHSIGGLIAPKLATETKLDGLILLEAPGESMTKITTAQVLEMNPAASTAQRAAIVKEQNGFYSKVTKTPPGQSIDYAGKTTPAPIVQLLKSVYAQKPLATARRVNIPVLVVQGGYDFQVPPGNGKRLVKAFPHVKLLYIPKMGHDLNIAPCRCLKQIHTGKDATLAPGLTAGIVAWLNNLK